MAYPVGIQKVEERSWALGGVWVFMKLMEHEQNLKILGPIFTIIYN